MQKTKLRKWGNSMGVIIPSSILKQIDEEDKETNFEISVSPDKEII